MINRVIERRMTKKRLVRWSQRGAHRLVQIWVAVLSSGRLPHAFQRWYPRFEPAGPCRKPPPPDYPAVCSTFLQSPTHPGWPSPWTDSLFAVSRDSRILRH
jgi:hypothetical protein